MARLAKKGVQAITFDQGQLAEVSKAIEQLRHRVFEARKESAIAAAQPVAKRARELAPDSRSSATAGGKNNGPTRNKWGKKYRDNPKWTGISIKHHVGEKAILGRSQDLLLIGLTYPKGNKANFNYTVNKEGRDEVFWGRPSGTVWKPVYRFMDKALDEKKREVIDIFVSKMKEAAEGG